MNKSKIFLFLLVLFLGFTPVLWFLNKPDVVINGVDTNFPLDPLVWFFRRFFVWNFVTNAGSDFSSSTAGLFFHFIQVIPFVLGFGLQVVQVFSLVFWFLVIVLGSLLLARTLFPEKKLIQILFVCLYAFNIYLFNTWENVKVSNLALVASLPFGFNLLILLERKLISYKKAALYAAFLGILLSGSGINPAYFLTFFLGLFLYLLGKNLFFENIRSLGKQIKNLVFLFLIIFFVNLFWILPSISFILNSIAPSENLSKLGYANWVNSLSQNTSLVNVFRLQGAWDWYAIDGATNAPYYIPYATNYFYKFPFIFFSFLISSLVILSLAFIDKSKKDIYAGFFVILFVSIFLSAGTHPPTGTIFSFISSHVPFFSFFRSPWYIFTPLTTLSIATLICLLMSRLTNYNLIQKNNWALSLVLIGLIVGNLIYNYPLVLGSIFREGREDSFYIKVPSYIFDSKSWLSNHKEGRIISYPDDEIEKFEWGYRGVEPMITLFSNNEVVYNALNSSTQPVSKIIKEYYQGLKTNRLESISSISAKLDIKYLLNKDDQLSLAPDLPELFNRLPKNEYGKWTFYTINPDESSKIYFPKDIYLGIPYEESYLALPLIGENNLLVNPDDSIVKNTNLNSKLVGNAILAINSQVEEFNRFNKDPSNFSNKIITRDLSKVVYRFEVVEEGMFQPVIDRKNLEFFGFDLSKQFIGTLNNNPISLKVTSLNNSYVFFEEINLSPGKYEFTFPLRTQNLISNGDFNQGLNFEKAGATKDQGIYTIEPAGSENGPYLSILNQTPKDISADFYVDRFDPSADYYIEIKSQRIYGNFSSINAAQTTGKGFLKTQREVFPNYPEWHTFSIFFDPELTESQLKINLVSSEISDVLGTKILYDDLKVYQLFSNNLFFVKKSKQSLSQPEISFKRVSPVFYQGDVSLGDKPHILAFLENYSPFWELTIYDIENNKITADSLHFTGDYYANAWYIANMPTNYKFTLIYRPQNMFWAGGVISLITILVIILSNLLQFIKKRND